MKTHKIYESLLLVTSEVEAIEKLRKNKEQGYAFRGIEDVYKTFHPLLIKNKVVLKIKTLNRNEVQFQTSRGTLMFKVSLEICYTFISVEDGSELECVVFGDAMDTGDKATGKAYSTAFKSMMFQMFTIPVDDGTDIENDSHEVVGASTQQAQVADAQPTTWLNLRSKDGALTTRGTSALQFIREGGSLAAIKAKYKMNKAEIEELAAEEKKRDEYIKEHGIELEPNNNFANE